MIFLSLEFDRIIIPEKFKTDKLYNIHFSLLPEYKGVYTSAWPILNGEEYTGVTLHKIDNGIDTGNIIDKKKITIGEDTTSQQLYNLYIENGTEVVLKNIQNILENKVEDTPQSSNKSTYYSKKSIDYANLKIDLNKTAYEIHNQIRAFSFPAFQLPQIDGISFYGSKILEHKSQNTPGSMVYEDDYYRIYSTIDYDIKLFKDRNEKLLEICSKGDIEKFREFVENHYPIKQKNSKGWDALIVSVFNGKYELAKELLFKHNWDINCHNNNGTTLAMYAMTKASYDNDTTFLKFLKEEFQTIDWARKDYFGKDIYHYAEELDNIDVLNVLHSNYKDI